MMKIKFWCLVALTFFYIQLSAMTTQDDRIVNSSGQEIELKGVNWFGFNNQQTMVDGLWNEEGGLASDFATIVYRMQLLGFNAIRLPFSFKDLYNLPPKNFISNCPILALSEIQASVTNPLVPLSPLMTIPPMLAPPVRVEGVCNDYFPNTTTIDRFLWVVHFFAENGFYVLVDNHLQDDFTVLENSSLWMQLWEDLVAKISQDPVSKDKLMIDILNEPDQYKIRWEAASGDPGLKDLYLSVMDRVYPINPGALFFIQGTGQGEMGANWGDGFATDPTLIAAHGLSDPNPFFNALMTKPYLNQVVIAPHFYPPSVSGGSGNDDGEELFNRLSSSFGYLTQSGYCSRFCKTFPVAIGEFGSHFADPNDIASLNDFAEYLQNTAAGADGKHQAIKNWFYWGWNPNSDLTGGLVEDNWLDILWNKIDYLTTIGLSPWYTTVAPIATGTLCVTILPVSGLSQSDLEPILIGDQIFEFTDFNRPTCHVMPAGSYSATPPDLFTDTMRFTATPQRLVVAENVPTSIYILYTGAPYVPIVDFEVSVKMGTPWQEEPSSGIYFNTVNLYVTNNGPTALSKPWRISLGNSAYKGVLQSWNGTVDSVALGQINCTANQSWQSLAPNGGNVVNLGMIISSTSPHFAPTSILVNGKPARIVIRP